MTAPMRLPILDPRLALRGVDPRFAATEDFAADPAGSVVASSGMDNILFPRQPSAGILTPEDRAAIKRNTILQVAANLLQAGGRSANQRGTLANIGSALAGIDLPGATQSAIRMRAVVDELNQRSEARNALKDLAKRYPVLPGATPEDRYAQLTNMVTEAATIPGLEDWVGKMSNVLAQTRPQRDLRARYAIRNMPDTEGGSEYGTYRVNLDDPTDRVRLGPGTPPIGASANRQDKLKASALLALAENALPTLEAAKPPNAVEAVLGSRIGQNLGGQAFLGEQRQLANQAGSQFSDALGRFTSGANMPENEVQRYLRIITPQFGDKPALQKRKLSAAHAVIKALRVAAGKGDYVDPNTAVSIIVQEANKITGTSDSAGGGGGGWQDYLPTGTKP